MRLNCLIVFVLSVAGTMAGCAPPPAASSAAMSPAQQKAVADSVRTVTDSVWAAGNRRDLDRLFGFYSVNCTLLQDGRPDPWPAHQAAARVFYSSLQAAEVRPLDYGIDVLSPTVAVWHGTYSYKLTDKTGKVISGAAANTWVLHREPGGWRIVHVHISNPPVPGR